MAFSLGTLQARLGLDESDYARGMLNANAITSTFGQGFATFVTNPLLGSIQLFKQVGTASVKTAVDVLGTAEAIQRLRQETGLSDEVLETLRAAMERAGYGAATSDDSLRKFVDTIGELVATGKARSPFLQGLERDIIGLGSQDERLLFVLDRLNEIEDATVRAAAANDIFGRRGGAAFRNVAQSSEELEYLIELFTYLGRVRGRETNDTLAELNTRLGTTQQALQGVGQALVAGSLLGIAKEFEITDENIANLARTVQERGVPAAIELGRNLGDIAQFLKEIVETAGRFNPRNLYDFLDTLPDRTLGVNLSPLGPDDFESISGAEYDFIFQLRRLQGFRDRYGENGLPLIDGGR